MEENLKQFKSNMSAMTTGNPNHRSNDQLDTIKNIKNLYNSRQKSFQMLKLDLKLCIEQNREQDLKY